MLTTMKVVIAHNWYRSAQPSGENAVVEMESRMLAEAGVEVLPLVRSSDEISAMSIAQRAALPLSPIYSHTTQRRLAAMLTTHRPQVLHLHNPYPLLSPWVVRTAHRHGVRVVQTVHNYRHVCASGLFVRDGKACHDCLGRVLPVPAVVYGCYRGSRTQSAVMAATLTLHRGTWKQVDRFLALTPAMAGFLRSQGIAADRIEVKPNAVPDPGRHDRQGAGFLFAGRLSAEKGIEQLLSAWQQYEPGSLGNLVIAGDGPLRAAVQAVAEHRPDVQFRGRLDPDALRDAIRAAAVVVVPSAGDDVSPVIAVEAMANARPVLATAAGGLPWLLGVGEPEPAGWTVPLSELARALPFAAAQACAWGPFAAAHASAMRAAARRRYERHFSPAVVVAQQVAVYEAVLSVDTTRAA